ncbi:hypothetical protein HPB50_019038 [Hyalomma asiaticum]|uniref:Uncharacterized protein n=1 Tax=Hyalomma asiaticum TaxID=266040 RepID=A0ACB7TN56_HYAAI|nr:hypothetical protein HPB50_019038 [Hyalomma asiaticum]
MRFNVHDDIALLREVTNINPFRDPTPWSTVAENLSVFVGRSFTPRAAKERCDRLMSQHVNDDRTNLRKSGTEEEYDEKAQLLDEIVELAKESSYTIRPLQRRASGPEPPSVRSGTQRAAADTRDAAAAALELSQDCAKDSS